MSRRKSAILGLVTALSTFALLLSGFGSFASNQLPAVRSGFGHPSANMPIKKQSAEDYLSEMLYNDVGLAKWPPERFPLKVFFVNGRGISGYRASFRAQMVDALNEWVNVSAGTLTWVEVPEQRLADITCEWTDKINRDKPLEAGFTLGTAREKEYAPIRTMGKASVTVLTHFKGKVLSDQDMRKVCLHELGHAYGLQGHSPFSNDIMYETTSRDQGVHLSARDINSIRNLYDSSLATKNTARISKADDSPLSPIRCSCSFGHVETSLNLAGLK
jgi:predicted Zn-dependent protease